MSSKNFSKQLIGLVLDNEWTVLDEVRIGRNTTGGTGAFFSVAYNVINRKGEKAFLKALDFSEMLDPSRGDPLQTLNRLTQDYLFEVELLEKVNGRKLDRIVLSLNTGRVYIEENNPLSIVPYIIFELAEGDVRKFINFTDNIELAWKLKVLHHVATGLKQLHSVGVSHQDLKPSNVLVFESKNISKIADLGRAVDQELSSNHDSFIIAGAPAYAPPEAVYGFVHSEWKPRRLGSDFYHLGSLLCFLFTGLPFNVLLNKYLIPAHRAKPTGLWDGTYNEILPYLRDAFSYAVEEFASHIKNQELKKELVLILRQLCDPDIDLRGHPLDRSKSGNSFSLERYIGLFNKLEVRARIGKYKSDN